MKYKICYILFIIILTSCKKEESYSMEYVSALEHIRAKELALNKGDTSAYNTLSMEFFDSPNEGVFLYTSLKMANKYNYGRAYDDAYMCLTDAYHKKENEELDDLDVETRKLALDLLFRGVKAKNKNCMSTLGNQFIIGKYLPKDEIRGEKLIEVSNQ